jgi:hypothetical protein
VCEYIIVFDAINILTNLHPTMIKEVAENVDLIIGYSPARIINQFVLPHAVKSAGQLQKLFDAGYDRIPKSFLCLRNDVHTIHTDCVKWLAENKCLSLLKEMFQHNPDFKVYYRELYNFAIRKGSIDVAKWLHDKKEMQCPSEDSVVSAIREGHLEVIKWIVAELKCPIDWKAVIEESYRAWRSHKVIDYLEDEANVTLEPETALYRLAAKGDLTGLQTVLSE